MEPGGSAARFVLSAPDPGEATGITQMTTRTIDGHALTASAVLAVARPDAHGVRAKAVLGEEARAALTGARDYIDAHFMHDDAPLMYSFNTGVGLFKDQRIRMSEMQDYQRLTVYAHATGIGEPFDAEAVRATMLLRANAFASNYSGPRVAVVDRLLDCLNAGVVPVIPQKGSVGASGDLAPLAYLAGAICGFDEAEAFYEGRRMPARAAGVSSIGETTRMMPFSCVTSRPRPPNSPRVCTCMSLKALAFI